MGTSLSSKRDRGGLSLENKYNSVLAIRDERVLARSNDDPRLSLSNTFEKMPFSFYILRLYAHVRAAAYIAASKFDSCYHHNGSKLYDEFEEFHIVNHCVALQHALFTISKMPLKNRRHFSCRFYYRQY